MIIIGYPGIGKSTLASNNPEAYCYLSANDYKIYDNSVWMDRYCQDAIDEEPYSDVVFVDYYDEVLDRLNETNSRVIVVAPALDLRDEWVKKLLRRYQQTFQTTHYYDYSRVEHVYDKDVQYALENAREFYVIRNMKYKLHSILDELR